MGKIVRVQANIVKFKQKLVIKLCIESTKSRAKGLKCAANLPGVLSVSVSSEGNSMTVLSEGIDAVKLLTWLRKKLGYAELFSIGAGGKLDKKREEDCDHHVGIRVAQPRYDNYENVRDRLLLWRLNHTQKDGSLSSQEAKQKWKLACQILAEKGLIPEDTDIEENERVFKAVMEYDNSDRMLCKDSGMNSRRIFFSDNTPNSDAESSNNKAELAKLAEEISKQSQEILSLKNTMNLLVALLQQQCQFSQDCLPSTTDEENFLEKKICCSKSHPTS